MKTFGFKKKKPKERERENKNETEKRASVFILYMRKKVLRFSFKRNSIFTKELLLVFGACVSGPNG